MRWMKTRVPCWSGCAKSRGRRQRSPTAASLLREDAPPRVFRLDLAGAGVIPLLCHLVMSPLPECNPMLQSIADVLTMLRGCGSATTSAVADGTSSPSPSTTTPMVLLLLNWTAHANSCLDTNLKLILAYYAVLLSMLHALDEHLHGGTQ